MKELEKDDWEELEKEDWMVDVSGAGEHVIQIKVNEDILIDFEGEFGVNKIRNLIESWMSWEIDDFLEGWGYDDWEELEEELEELKKEGKDVGVQLQSLQTKVDKELAMKFAVVRKYFNIPTRQFLEEWMKKMIKREEEKKQK